MSIELKELRVSDPKLSISVPPLGILLIEDNVEDAYLIRRTLNQIGNIFWEEDLVSGLGTAGSEKLDLVLLSMNLKDGGPYDNFETFLKAWPELPIILICDAGTKLLGELATQHGALAVMDRHMLENSDYLIKLLTKCMIMAKFIKEAEEPSPPENTDRGL